MLLNSCTLIATATAHCPLPTAHCQKCPLPIFSALCEPCMHAFNISCAQARTRKKTRSKKTMKTESS
jgi:hypothetical protein